MFSKKQLDLIIMKFGQMGTYKERNCIILTINGPRNRLYHFEIYGLKYWGFGCIPLQNPEIAAGPDFYLDRKTWIWKHQI